MPFLVIYDQADATPCVIASQQKYLRLEIEFELTAKHRIEYPLSIILLQMGGLAFAVFTFWV
jgi:hypothetical protein